MHGETIPYNPTMHHLDKTTGIYYSGKFPLGQLRPKTKPPRAPPKVPSEGKTSANDKKGSGMIADIPEKKASMPKRKTPEEAIMALLNNGVKITVSDLQFGDMVNVESLLSAKDFNSGDTVTWKFAVTADGNHHFRNTRSEERRLAEREASDKRLSMEIAWRDLDWKKLFTAETIDEEIAKRSALVQGNPLHQRRLDEWVESQRSAIGSFEQKLMGSETLPKSTLSGAAPVRLL